VALVVGFLASGFAYAAVGSDPTVSDLFRFVIPVQWAGTIAVIAWLVPRRFYWRTELRATVARADGWGVLLGVAVQIALSIVAYVIIVELFDGSAPTQEVVDAASEAIGGLDRVLVFLGLVVLGPLSEELVFRGVLLRALEPHGRRYAIVVSSVAFAGLHLLDPNAVVAVPFLFVLGAILAHQTLETGRLGRAVAIHAGFNLVTVVAILAT